MILIGCSSKKCIISFFFLAITLKAWQGPLFGTFHAQKYKCAAANSENIQHTTIKKTQKTTTNFKKEQLILKCYRNHKSFTVTNRWTFGYECCMSHSV